MLTGRKLIAVYILSAVLPYVFLCLFILTAVLFAQQAGRIAELALYSDVPFSLLAEVAAALLPNVLILTLPAAVLAGIIIGFARMGSDSEVVAMRAAGMGTWSILWPVLLIGLVVTAATTFLQLKEAPRAARNLKKAALEGALRKLDSPVEPRTFTTDIPGYVIYVRDGDKTLGSWGRVFIYSSQPDGSARIVSARSGRIDASGDKSELVLSDARATKLPPHDDGAARSYVVERLEQLRIAISTGRAEILNRINRSERSTEELDWSDLTEQASSGTMLEKNEGQRVLHRKLALSLSPLIFAILGGAIGLRVRRGGRGIGVLLSIVLMVVYYLVSLLGESLARTGTLSPVTGLWAATALMLVLTLILLMSNRIAVDRWLPRRGKKTQPAVEQAVTYEPSARRVESGKWGFPSLLDTGLFRTLSASFILGFIVLVSIFIIFTLFEMWRFIGSRNVAAKLVANYILFLIPLITVELFPATMLIAVLVTYAMLARRSEAIAWWASGQSVYRLMLPGLIFSLVAGAGAWVIQEQLMPYTNVKQDALRARIRGGEARAITGTGRQWLASAESNRLYSYEFVEQHNTLNDVAIYDFEADSVHLASLVTGSNAVWNTTNKILVKNAETLTFRAMGVERQVNEEKEIQAEPIQLFKPTIDKPSQLSSRGLSDYLKAIRQRGMETSALAVALQRKYAAPFSVVVMAFIGMPLALSFGKKGAVLALCAAVAVSVAYWGIGGGFQQLGNHGLLPPAVAGWSPPIIFAAAGTYVLSRVRT